MKHTLLLIIATLAISYSASAQFAETIRSGRPGQAIGPFSLGAKTVQIQTGLSYQKIEADFFETDILNENTVVRWGIGKCFELSGVLNWQAGWPEINGVKMSGNGINDTQFGARVAVVQQRGWLPTIGLQGRALLRAQSEAYRRDQIGSTFLLATHNQITDWLAFTTNWGLTWEGDGEDPNDLYIWNLSFGLSDRWGGFVEMYGNLINFSDNYDAGLSLLINDDLQLDASAGWQGRNNVSDWFVDVGVSWRVHWRE